MTLAVLEFAGIDRAIGIGGRTHALTFAIDPRAFVAVAVGIGHDAGAVIAGGGEVLRYIGDASLAIFPIERYADPRQACQTALDVALDSIARAERVNADRLAHGEPAIEFGVGLHTGTVMYGNIGTPERIEFTVIGKAANEAARIEAQCKELNETILVSDTFAGHLDRPWRSHGTFELRNIGRPIEILSPAG